jgi:uncharacterized protein (DUF1501 family)
LRESHAKNRDSRCLDALGVPAGELNQEASMRSNRRQFVKESLASSTLVAMGSSSIPLFLGRSAAAARDAARSDRVLVVVQLLGGNDGLNTVVPHGLDGYNRARRALRLPSGAIHKITAEIGLHPAMGAMAKLVEKGQLAVIQGVGYPNPDRSHFRSMEIWETARLENDARAIETGWLGRALDARERKPGDDPPGIHLDSRALPLALRSKKTEVPSVDSIEGYKLQVAGTDQEKKAARAGLNQLAKIERRDDPLLGFIRQTTLAAYESSDRLEQLADKKSASAKYPNFGLARRLEMIARIIKADFGTRIFYTSLDGFDTHANQLGTHAALLNQLSDSVAAFHDDLAAAGMGERVALLTFSEFGRRVEENASQGTDHGAAAPVLVVGPVAKAGLIGEHPSLDKLDDGDLKFHTDFRRVYAALLADWLNCPPDPIVGTGFERLPLFRRA